MYTRKKIMKRNGIKKRILTTVLAFTIVLGIAMSNVPTMVTDGASVKVEAASKKKDKKKPVIKMSGKSQITVTKGTSVKIPKVTAKDNKDGNVTKKIKVTVKKGKKSYSSIAKKIKNNKKVKFTATGKYTITYTVKDKAGNKATKKRYVMVKKKEKTTTENATTEDPKPETPTVTPTDYSKYDMKDVTVNGATYKTTRDTSFFSAIAAKYSYLDEDIKITVENDYMEFKLDKSESSSFDDASILLELMGSIKATDANGNDISDNIVIYDYALSETENKNYLLRIFVEDDRGYAALKQITVMYITDLKTTYEDYDGILLKTEPTVLGYINTIKNE